MPLSKEDGLNAISMWVPALIDFRQRTEGTCRENVNLDEHI